ncbi:MAG: polysaccharide biosynthesis C-terminal domain-containing protein [Bacteroidetes bacterium]|nr:polysaccharide biosynthesis C-terminal domain-containing protein [Bacteroidota bacterium]
MKEAAKFYSSLGLLLLLNGLVKPVWIFGIDRQVQNVTGTIEYGTYFALFNLSIVFSFLLDFGSTTFLNRQLAARQKLYLDNIGSFLLIKLIFGIIYFAVVAFTARLAGVSRWDMLFLVLLIQFLTSLFVFLRAVITAQQWFTTDAWLSVLDKTLMIILCGSFLYTPFVGAIDIKVFLLSQVASTGLATVVVIIILLQRRISIHRTRFSLVNPKILKEAFPFALLVFLMSVHNRLDGFLLERLHHDGAKEAGIYAGAYRLLDAANMVGYLVASFLMPYIARKWSEKEIPGKLILQSRHLLMIFSVILVAVAWMLSGWIQVHLYHNSDAYAEKVMQWCLSSLVGYSIVQVYGSVLTATGYIKAFTVFVLLSVLMNVILNVILIPSFGALGCSWAALASQLTGAIAVLWYVESELAVKDKPSSWLLYIIAAGVSVLILEAGKWLQINTILLLILVAFWAVLIISVTKIFSVREFLLSFTSK